MARLPWLSVSGDRIVDDTGRTVRLTGVGLGGWMNMENFITGYPGNEENIRRVMRERMGADAYEAFFDSFYTAFFDDADVDHDGSLDEAEVLSMLSARLPHAASRVVAHQMLAIADRNQDGKVSKEELVDIMLTRM